MVWGDLICLSFDRHITCPLVKATLIEKARQPRAAVGYTRDEPKDRLRPCLRNVLRTSASCEGLLAARDCQEVTLHERLTSE